MIQDFRSLVKRPKWVTNQPKKASRVRWDKAQLLRKAKENFNKDFSTARANGQPNEYEKGELVWVVKESARLPRVDILGPYVVDQVMEGYR